MIGSMNQDCKVSIVVPAYNVEDYIEKCVASLLNQSYTNLEILLVDDGSTDSTSRLCDGFATFDSRVKVVHKANGGPSSAREAGITASTGDYLMIVDGDDWVDLDTVEQCVSVVLRYSNIDVVIFSYMREWQNSSFPTPVLRREGLYPSHEFRSLIYKRLFGPTGEALRYPEAANRLDTCCVKFYKIEVARKGRYYDTQLVGSSEDALFNMHALAGCSSAYYLDRPMYHYRKGISSLSNNYRPNLTKQWENLFCEIERIIKIYDLGDEFQEALYGRVALSILGIGLNEIADKSSSRRVHIRRVSDYLCSSRYQSAIERFDLNRLPLAWRIFIGSAKHQNGILTYMALAAICYLKGKK